MAKTGKVAVKVKLPAVTVPKPPKLAVPKQPSIKGATSTNLMTNAAKQTNGLAGAISKAGLAQMTKAKLNQAA